jgi:tRNA nucleotidyltransferase/poly(A) polymerase
MGGSAGGQSQHLEPREAAVAIVRRLREQGFVAYLAGGCVRDELLGQDP